jgi:CubicO group peptidase (beta-lactamase class C family)
MSKLFSFILLLLLFAQPAAAMTEPSTPVESDYAALDSYITAQMEKHGIKGVSIAVVKGSQTVYLQGYGESGKGRPMSSQTPMYIGSTSKSITGLAIAQLVEAGKIDLAAPVRKYIPWFQVSDPNTSQIITVSHFVHHTSGLSESGFKTRIPVNASLEQAVRALADAEQTAAPGEEFQYFNTGYSVLAMIIESASGQSYESYIQANIFDPLGMTSTFTDPQQAAAHGLSQGYTRLFGIARPQSQPHRRYEVSAGYIISTAEDMARFATAMKNRGVYNDIRVLSDEGMRRLFVPVRGYGMGWFIEGDIIQHGGANETYKSFLVIYPDRDLAIVLLINQGYMLDHYISAPQIFKGVESIVFGEQPPSIGEGWSTKTIGLGLLGFVLALGAFQAYNLWKLRGWRERARRMTPAKIAVDVGISFLIPAVIFIIIYTQLQGFFGYRFNLTYQMSVMFVTLTDISILMIVALVPDLLQGLIKTAWVLTGKTRANNSALEEMHPKVAS